MPETCCSFLPPEQGTPFGFTDPPGRYTYDFSGNLRTVTNRKGQVTTHTYDAQDRRIRSDYADGSFVAYEYDPTGQLLTATDSQTGTITNTYDALGRLMSQVTPQGAITYAYDALGRRQRMEVDGLVPVEYQYDASSRLTQINQGIQTVALSYDGANRRTSLVLPNGIVVAYTYETSRLIAQSFTGPQGLLGDLTYAHDANGNRVGTGGSWARSLLPASVPSSSYDSANEQVTFGDITQTFDASGNVLTQSDATGTRTYTWDTRNRLVAIAGPSLTASFLYDALGRRIAKTINGVTIIFHYDGPDIVRESSELGDAAYLRTLAIDEALTRTDASSMMAYLADILGSTVALADRTPGVSTEYTYEPFGATQPTDTSSPNSLQFTGRENDGTGLYYHRARYYSPQLHRFLAEDRLGLSTGVNLYRYVLNNPLALIDPLGLDVTVTLYRGARGFGHIGVRVNASEPTDTVGHYPLTHSAEVLAGLDVSGEVTHDLLHKNDKDILDTITIPRTAAQDRAMERAIQDSLQNYRYYNLYFRNCTTFVEEVLRAGGVDVPDTNLPNELIRWVQQKYGNGDNPLREVPRLPGGFAP